jgi:hypothetical protein
MMRSLQLSKRARCHRAEFDVTSLCQWFQCKVEGRLLGICSQFVRRADEILRDRNHAKRCLERLPVKHVDPSLKHPVERPRADFLNALGVGSPVESDPPRTGCAPVRGGSTGGVRICMRSLMDWVVRTMASLQQLQVLAEMVRQAGEVVGGLFARDFGPDLVPPAVPVIRNFNIVQAIMSQPSR